MAKRKKVVLALGSRHTVPPVSSSSGIAWIVYNFAKRLSEQNFDVHVISKWNDELEEFNKKKYYHVNIDTFWKRLELLFWKYCPYRIKKRIFTFSQPDRIVYYKGIRKKIKEIQPDVVLSIVHAELFMLLKKACPEIKHAYWYHSSSILGLNPQLLSFLMEHSDGILTLNDLTVNAIKQTYPEKNVPIRRIYNALDLSGHKDINEKEVRAVQRNVWGYDESDIVIGYAGRFAREKNILKLFKAAFELRSKGYPIKLLMAGDIKFEKMPDMNYYNLCMDYANEYLDGTVTFTGWLSSNELQKFYCAIDLGILLSQEREGSPMFFLEACSFGKPMIATNVGSNPEHLSEGENGYLVDVNEIEKELPGTILKVISDTDSYNKMSDRCREYVKKHHVYDEKVLEFEQFLVDVQEVSY